MTTDNKVGLRRGVVFSILWDWRFYSYFEFEGQVVHEVRALEGKNSQGVGLDVKIFPDWAIKKLRLYLDGCANGWSYGELIHKL